MTHTSLPSRDAIKAQARRLRTTLAQSGTMITHSAALEHVAHQWGYHDWNTLSAAVQDSPHRWQLDQPVSGTYLGHPFTGRVKSVRPTGPRHTRLVLVFDAPIDVVSSTQFSAFRRQITCTVNDKGCTLEKTSDGKPHVVLNMQ